MSKKLDKKDWALLKELCTNARRSNNQIGKAVGLSTTGTAYRIERLKKSGIITGFFAIINHDKLGTFFSQVLIKTTDKEEKLITFLCEYPTTIVVDKISGEYNYLIEIGTSSFEELLVFINKLRTEFSETLMSYEVHPIIGIHKVEQLPVEIVKKEKRKLKKTKEKKEKNTETITLDKKDFKLLFELNKDATTPVHRLAEKINCSSETIVKKIKRLKKEEIILSFSAKINLRKLGYDTYVLILDTKPLSESQDKKLKYCLSREPRIRYAVMSATVPKSLMYIAIKSTLELDAFVKELKQALGESLVNIRYLLARDQHKYELFPEGFIR